MSHVQQKVKDSAEKNHEMVTKMIKHEAGERMQKEENKPKVENVDNSGSLMAHAMPIMMN